MLAHILGELDDMFCYFDTAVDERVVLTDRRTVGHTELLQRVSHRVVRPAVIGANQQRPGTID